MTIQPRSARPSARQPHLFAATIVGYADQLSRLASGCATWSCTIRAGDPDAVAQAEIDAARAVLDLRTDCAPACSRSSARAEAAANADRHARDRQLDDAERRRWSAMRREIDGGGRRSD
jgi:hypothetical protein